MAAKIVSEENCGMKKMKLKFSLSIVSEDDFDMEGHQELSLPQPELEDDCFYDDNDQMLVNLANMIFNLVVVQDPDTDEPLHSCDHQFNEIVVMREQAEAFICQIGRLIKEQDNLYLKSKQKCKFITSGENQICLEDTMSAKITILQCMATKDAKSGVPVVLNFTGTDNFFCCTNEGGEITLKVTRYDKTKLHIPGDDREKLAHVFYMSQTPDGHRHFESALHRGWFIHTVDGNAVKMQRGKLTSSNCFVLIETDSTTTTKY